MSRAQSVVKEWLWSPINVLLVTVPVAFVLRYLLPGAPAFWLFLCSALAIVPLAGVLGKATEQIAMRSGPGLGGLLNATFGNAAELIIGFIALSKGLTGVVKASLTGSIIGNLLLVLGAAMFAGGLKRKKQVFNGTAARAAAAAMGIAAIAMVTPTVFHTASANHSGKWSPVAEQHLSLAIAFVLLAAYAGTLIFSLVTHRGLFTVEEEGTRERPAPLGISIAMLAGASAFIAFLSEFLLGSLEEAMEHLGLTEAFVGVIVVALVGNAAEHASSVSAAMKNRMDLSLGIAFGSSTQIALFVAPLLVICSHLIGKPIDLEFTLPEIASILGAVWVAQLISSDGESNWMEGLLLLALYAILALLFFFLPPG